MLIQITPEDQFVIKELWNAAENAHQLANIGHADTEDIFKLKRLCEEFLSKFRSRSLDSN